MITKTKILLATLLFTLVVPSVAGAWVINDPIVPCGPPYTNSDGTPGIPRPQCTQCELLHLADNLVDFILIGVAPILATFFFIVAGVYIMLGGAKPDMLATGKRMFSSAFIGIIIVMLAWLGTNTLITSLVATTVSGQLPSGGNFSFTSADWWKLSCDTIGLSEDPPVVYTQASYSGGTGTLVVSGEEANETSDGATITWTTNALATSQVHHGAGSNMLAYTPISNTPRTSHSITLSGYPPNTQVSYQVISVNSTGYEAVGSIFSFTTLP